MKHTIKYLILVFVFHNCSILVYCQRANFLISLDAVNKDRISIKVSLQNLTKENLYFFSNTKDYWNLGDENPCYKNSFKGFNLFIKQGDSILSPKTSQYFDYYKNPNKINKTSREQFIRLKENETITFLLALNLSDYKLEMENIGVVAYYIALEENLNPKVKSKKIITGCYESNELEVIR